LAERQQADYDRRADSVLLDADRKSTPTKTRCPQDHPNDVSAFSAEGDANANFRLFALHGMPMTPLETDTASNNASSQKRNQPGYQPFLPQGAFELLTKTGHV